MLFVVTLYFGLTALSPAQKLAHTSLWTHGMRERIRKIKVIKLLG